MVDSKSKARFERGVVPLYRTASVRNHADAEDLLQAEYEAYAGSNCSAAAT